MSEKDWRYHYMHNQDSNPVYWLTMQGLGLWLFNNHMYISLQGPIKVTVQELDGSFNHTLQIEENSLKHDIPCHSKSRRYFMYDSKTKSYDYNLCSLKERNKVQHIVWDITPPRDLTEDTSVHAFKADDLW